MEMKEVEVRCHVCGKRYRDVAFTFLDTSKDEEGYKEFLLEDPASFFSGRCPSCDDYTYIAKNFTYYDPAHKWCIALNVENKPAEECFPRDKMPLYDEVKREFACCSEELFYKVEQMERR